MTRAGVPSSQARFWLGAAGVLAAAAAVAADSHVVGWAAVVLLGLALASRMIAAHRARSRADGGDS